MHNAVGIDEDRGMFTVRCVLRNYNMILKSYP